MIGDSWGSTPAERAETFPCDEHVSSPRLVAWRAVTVAATPADVWSRLVQVRLAPYSYDWIDNLGRTSPRDLRNLDDPRPGDPFTAVGGRPTGRVLAVDHERDLTARIMGAVMTYRVAASGPSTTRLLLKIVADPPLGTATLMCLGDLVMARRQLLNLKELAESAEG